jgi:hypothetical protein
LRVILERQQQIGGVYEYRTTSRHTIENILSGLLTVKAQAGGQLAWVPLTMRVVPQTTTTPEGITTTIYVVQIVYRGSPTQLLSDVRELLSVRAPLLTEIRELEGRVKALPPAEEEPDDAADTQAEFYPELAQAEPPTVEVPGQGPVIVPEEAPRQTLQASPAPAFDVSTLTKTECLHRIQARFRELVPGQTAAEKADRRSLMESCFNVRLYRLIEDMSVSNLRKGLSCLLAARRDASAPPPDDEDVPMGEMPLGAEAEAHLASLREERTEASSSSAPLSNVVGVLEGPTETPPLTATGYVTADGIEAVRVWAQRLGQVGVMAEWLKICPPGPDGLPLVTPEMYGRLLGSVSYAHTHPEEAAHG